MTIDIGGIVRGERARVRAAQLEDLLAAAGRPGGEADPNLASARLARSAIVERRLIDRGRRAIAGVAAAEQHDRLVRAVREALVDAICNVLGNPAVNAPFRATAGRVNRDPDVVDEALAEAAVAVTAAVFGPRGVLIDSSLPGYLHGMVRRKAVDRVRRRGDSGGGDGAGVIDAPAHDPLDDLDREHDRALDRKLITDLLAVLTPREHDAFVISSRRAITGDRDLLLFGMSQANFKDARCSTLNAARLTSPDRFTERELVEALSSADTFKRRRSLAREAWHRHTPLGVAAFLRRLDPGKAADVQRAVRLQTLAELFREDGSERDAETLRLLHGFLTAAAGGSA